MDIKEGTNLLANALLCEMSKAYFEGDGVASCQAVLEMNFSAIREQINDYTDERLKSIVAGKGLIYRTTKFFQAVSVIGDIQKKLPEMMRWASDIAGEKIEKADTAQMKEYALSGINLSGAMQTLINEFLLEKGL